MAWSKESIEKLKNAYANRVKLYIPAAQMKRLKRGRQCYVVSNGIGYEINPPKSKSHKKIFFYSNGDGKLKRLPPSVLLRLTKRLHQKESK